MNESILHKAIVVSATRRQLTVDVISGQNDCHGCGIAPLCNIKSGNRISLPVDGASDRFLKGQPVILKASGKSRLKSAAILLMVPTLLVIATAVIMSGAGVADEVTAMSSLGAGAVYFLLLYMMRRLTSSAVGWTVEPAE